MEDKKEGRSQDKGKGKEKEVKEEVFKFKGDKREPSPAVDQSEKQVLPLLVHQWI